MAVSSAEQIEQAADEVENRNKADDRHMEAPRFASATPPPTSRGTEALERLSNLEARVEEQERAIRRLLSLLIAWVERDEKEHAWLRGSKGAKAQACQMSVQNTKERGAGEEEGKTGS